MFLTNCTRVNAIAKSRNDTSDNEMGDRARRCLKGAADAQNGASDHDALPSAQIFTENHGQDRTEKATLYTLVSTELVE